MTYVIVTGASGLVGSAIVRELSVTGMQVLAVTATRTAGIVGRSLQIDLSASEIALPSDERLPKAIVHCAALVPGPDEDTEACRRTIEAIDRNVADLARRWGCATVYISTCGLYDRATKDIKTVSAPVGAFGSPYLAAKMAGEALFGSLPRSTTLRISGPVGSGMKSSYLLPSFVQGALRGQVLEIWGHGTREQDFVDVRDVARAARMSVEQDGGLFNVASGRPVTMIELAETICATVGRGKVWLSGKSDLQDGTTARYSIDATMKATGWQPEYTLRNSISALAEGMRATHRGS